MNIRYSFCIILTALIFISGGIYARDYTRTVLDNWTQPVYPEEKYVYYKEFMETFLGSQNISFKTTMASIFNELVIKIQDQAAKDKNVSCIWGGYVADIKTSNDEILSDLEKFVKARYVDIDNDEENEILIRFSIGFDEKKEIVRIIDKIDGKYVEVINLDESFYKGDAYINTTKAKKGENKELIIKIVQYNSSYEDALNIYSYKENKLKNIFSINLGHLRAELGEKKEVTFSFDDISGWLEMNIKGKNIIDHLYKRTMEKWNEEYIYDGNNFLLVKGSQRNFTNPNTYDAGEWIKQQIEENPIIDFDKMLNNLEFKSICKEPIWKGDMDNNGKEEMLIDPGDYVLLLYKDDKGQAKWKKFESGWVSSVSSASDLNNDGILELLVSTSGGNGEGYSFDFLIGKVNNEFIIIKDRIR